MSLIRKARWFWDRNRAQLVPIVTFLVAALLLPLAAHAQSPWETTVNNLEASFTGPIAKGLSLVAIVWGGLMFAFAEGDSKRMLAGIIFGCGMALGAAQFVIWLFG